MKSKKLSPLAVYLVCAAAIVLLLAADQYTKSLADTVVAVKDAGADAQVQTEILKAVNGKLGEVKSALAKLEEAEAKAAAMDNVKDQAFFYKDVVKTAMDELRAPVDEVEMMVDKKAWPVPTYADLMFEV